MVIMLMSIYFMPGISKEMNKESCKAGFPACGGSLLRYISFPPQGDHCFLSYKKSRGISYKIKQPQPHRIGLVFIAPQSFSVTV